jgi:hypothetical protein
MFTDESRPLLLLQYLIELSEDSEASGNHRSVDCTTKVYRHSSSNSLQ